MLTGASNTFHSLGARLPRINDVCALNVYQVAHVIALTKSNAWDVFDVDLRRISTVSCDARLCKFTFPNKPAPSCRYLEADGRMIWVTSGVRLSASARPGPDGTFADDKLIELLKKPLSYFNLSKAERTLASGSEKITPLSRHRAVGAPNPVDAALDRVATDMHKPVNAGIRALVLNYDSPCSTLSFNGFERLITDSLVQLSIHNLILSPRAVSQLSLSADKLHMLDLSGAAALDSASCRDLGLLLQRWRADPSGPEIRKLVLDKIDKVAHSIELHFILYGGCMPGQEQWEDVDSYSHITSGTPRVYVSCDSCDVRTWREAIEMTPMMPPLAFPKVHIVCAATATTAADRPIKMQKVARASLTTLTADVARASLTTRTAPWLNSDYSNETRVRDRYMIQWFAHKCSNCGAVWKADCVTISYRQTAVSQCLKGQKKCVDRDEYARMQAGERFITNKHVSGNGGTDLTPSPAMIDAAKTAGLLVAINPANKTPVCFTPHPTRPPPAKVPVLPSSFLPEALRAVLAGMSM